MPHPCTPRGSTAKSTPGLAMPFPANLTLPLHREAGRARAHAERHASSHALMLPTDLQPQGVHTRMHTHAHPCAHPAPARGFLASSQVKQHLWSGTLHLSTDHPWQRGTAPWVLQPHGRPGSHPLHGSTDGQTDFPTCSFTISLLLSPAGLSGSQSTQSDGCSAPSGGCGPVTQGPSGWFGVTPGCWLAEGCWGISYPLSQLLLLCQRRVAWVPEEDHVSPGGSTQKTMSQQAAVPEGMG